MEINFSLQHLSEFMDTNDENCNDISHDKTNALSEEDAIFFAGLIDLMIQRLQSSNNN